MLEKETYNLLVGALDKYFIIYPERWSKDGHSRIDMIIKDKLSDAVFGMEIKKIDYKRGHECWELLDQAMKYSKCEFNIGQGWQQIPIFI